MVESLPLGAEQRPVGSPATEECHDIGNPRFATDDGRDQSGHRTGPSVNVNPSARSDSGGSDLNLQREGLVRNDRCEGALYLLPFDSRGSLWLVGAMSTVSQYLYRSGLRGGGLWSCA